MSNSLPKNDTDAVHDNAVDAHEMMAINKDGRSPYEWDTKYPPEAIKMIIQDTVYVSIIFLSALGASFICASGVLATDWQLNESTCKYLQYAFPGLLGGITFGMKYLYRTVARGYWHRDRRVWRVLSPWIALSVSFAIGIMVEAGLFSSSTGELPTYVEAKRVGIGFLSGYFADQAVGKMCDLADVLFGRRNG